MAKKIRSSAASKKNVFGGGSAAENKIQRRAKKLGGEASSKPKKLGKVIGKLDSAVDTKKFLAYVVGDEVRMVPRKPRGKSKRVGCHVRKPNETGGKRRNRAGGKMTKAQVAAEFQDLTRFLTDDVMVRAAWNEYVDSLHKRGLVSSAVANSSVPTKFLKRKSNRTGGSRNRAGGMTKAQVISSFKRKHGGSASFADWQRHIGSLRSSGSITPVTYNALQGMSLMELASHNRTHGKRR